MIIEWEQDICAAINAPLRLVADCCQQVEGISLPLAVHIRLTDDETIHQLNCEYRSTDRATDVLSFPTVNYPKGKTAGDCPERLKAEYDFDLRACQIGDVVLSYDHIKAQAEEYGHSVSREICYLLSHSLFHLFGYDHMQDDEKKEMRKMEEKALSMAGLSRDTGADEISDEDLLALARKAMERSYSPYSHYPVGAALLCEDGRIFLGCNIENASYGATNCAERTALFTAVSEGERKFRTIAIASKDSAPYPCGICRQALNEFSPNIRVLVTWGNGEVAKTTLPELLPHGFGPESLQE